MPDTGGVLRSALVWELAVRIFDKYLVTANGKSAQATGDAQAATGDAQAATGAKTGAGDQQRPTERANTTTDKRPHTNFTASSEQRRPIPGCFSGGFIAQDRKVPSSQRHALCVHAIACCCIAWKAHTSRLRVDLTAMYGCLLTRYQEEHDERGLEQFKEIFIQTTRKIVIAYVGKRKIKHTVVKQVVKTMQAISVEKAELAVLRACDWKVHVSTMVDVAGTLIAVADTTATNTQTTCAAQIDQYKMAQLKIVASDRAMRLTMDTEFMFHSSFSVIRGAIVAVCEAAKIIDVKMKEIPGLEMLSI